jgi:SWIM zinc finger
VVGVEQSYSYAAASSVTRERAATALNLATSGGRVPRPQFFSGFLGAPRQAAQALLVISEVARTRYYEPPGMVAAKIRAADPVVTSNVDRLRFESFSACCGVYARFDLEPAMFDGAFADWGTTNVDFNPPMRAALAGVRDAEPMLLNVGLDEVALSTLDGTVIERKVPLPTRWLKGFAEVQIACSKMLLQHELSGVEARRFLQALPRTPSRAPAWTRPAGGGLRLASTPSPQGGVCLAGPERLRLLEKLIPFARTMRVYGDSGSVVGAAAASAWELELNGARAVFVASPEVYRGFSGEGGVLSDLAAADPDVVEAVAEELHGDPVVDSAAIASSRMLSRLEVNRALVALGAAGKVGFDLAPSAFFHRVLPFDLSALEEMHPRLRDAAGLYEAGSVQLVDDGAIVRSDEVDYRVAFDADGSRCTCAWYAKHRGERGPCKHVLAAEHARRTALMH